MPLGDYLFRRHVGTHSGASAGAASLSYRPDIDGLRAIAVLAVIAYHAVPAWLPGGFTGVDVFFVISGYLITGLMLREAEHGGFNIRTFYARRVRRIFPALIAVLTVALAAGWYWLLSAEFAPLAKSAAAAAGFVANVQFWREAGYFDSAAELKPLLHLWSLAVEEQFYLVWPWLVLATVSNRTSLARLAWGLLAVSFALNVAFVARSGSATFFLPLTRLWELMAGALLAVRGSGKSTHPRPWGSAVGLILVAAGFSLLNGKMHYPGAWALLPVAGALLVVAAGPEDWLRSRLLSTRALVFLGLISYPLYLWHWPALALVRIIDGPNATGMHLVIALSASVVLAAATFWWIERPIRTGSGPAGVTRLALAMALVLSVALLGSSEVFKPRLDDERLKQFNAAAADWQYPGPSFVRERGRLGMDGWTVGQGPRKVLVWGDSNAEQYGPRVERLLAHAGPDAARTQVVFATLGSCPPIRRARIGSQVDCAAFAEQAYARASSEGISTVILIAQWTGYLNSASLVVTPANASELRGAAASAAVREELVATIRGLQKLGKEVVIVHNIPVANELGPQGIVSRRWGGAATIHDEGISRESWDATRKTLAGGLTNIAHDTGATLIDPTNWLCDQRRCPALDVNGVPRYHDGFHLRASFVRNQVEYLDSAILGGIVR